jgi:hypothetical protein
MADQNQKQQQQQQQNKPGNETRNPGADDPRHAPESGEPTEGANTGQRGARGNHAGDRDESGRQGNAGKS